MALLKELNLDEDTIVFFTSDNGAAHGPLENSEFFNASGRLRGYKGSLYEGGIRVPMIVRWPGHIKSSSASDRVTYFPDMMPTLAELADAAQFVPDNIAGLSIVQTLLQKEQQKKHSVLYWEDADYQRVPPYQVIPETLQQAIRMGQWKAVKNSPHDPIELYDLSTDSAEKNNVAAEHPRILRQITEIMNASHKNAPPQIDMTAKEAERLYVPGRLD